MSHILCPLLPQVLFSTGRIQVWFLFSRFPTLSFHLFKICFEALFSFATSSIFVVSVAATLFYRTHADNSFIQHVFVTTEYSSYNAGKPCAEVIIILLLLGYYYYTEYYISYIGLDVMSFFFSCSLLWLLCYIVISITIYI